MDRLSPLDAGFIDIEDQDRHASLAIASIAVFEGPAPTHEEFSAAIAARLALVPRYQQRVRKVPLRIGPPVWVDDPHFDLRYHIRRTALPAPGGDAELSRLMGRVMAQRLDRDHPLWEYWVAEGLAGGRWALISKVHHCAVDGISGTDLYRVVFDLTPDAETPALGPRPLEPEPSNLALTLDALWQAVLLPALDVRAIVGALTHPERAIGRAAATTKGLLRLARSLVPAHRSSLTGHIGQQRRYSWARTSFEDIRAIRHALGGTVNDVVLASIAGGFRALLLARGEEPAPHLLPSLVPVSVRAPGEDSILDNRVSLMVVDLPVHVADPVERLKAVQEEMASLKASGEALAGESVTTLARYVPYSLASLSRFAFRVPQRELVTVTTNVPGPRQPIYCLGRRLVEMMPYVPIATTMRIGVSIFSYDGAMTFGLTGDYDTTGDIEVLARGIESGVAELRRAATAAA